MTFRALASGCIGVARQSSAFSLVLVVFACKSAEQSEKPSVALNRRLAELVCNRKAECCGELYAEIDAQACRVSDEFSISVRSNRIGAVVERGNATYDAERFVQCLDDLEKLECEAWVRASGGELPPSCRDYVVGRLAIGSECRDHYDCASGRCAFVSGPSGTADPSGACAARLGEGESCTGADEDCLAELECRARSTGGHVCVRGAPAGSACAQGSDCDSNVCQNARCVGECRLFL